MGDRANIRFVGERYTNKKNATAADHRERPMFFYTHWQGYKLPLVLQDALARGKSRWNDPTYLARIIFSEMVKDDVMAETGFGLSLRIGDGEDQVITVDCLGQTVESKDYGIKKQTFRAFCARDVKPYCKD